MQRSSWILSLKVFHMCGLQELKKPAWMVSVQLQERSGVNFQLFFSQHKDLKDAGSNGRTVICVQPNSCHCLPTYKAAGRSQPLSVDAAVSAFTGLTHTCVALHFTTASCILHPRLPCISFDSTLAHVARYQIRHAYVC